MFDIFSKKVPIGVDVGHFSVKAAVTTENRGEVYVVEREIMPQRQSRDDAAPDEAVVSALKTCVAACLSARPKAKPSLGATFQGDGALCFYLELPRLKKDELEMAARAAAVKQIPFGLDEAFVTYIPVPPLAHPDKAGMFVVAFRRAPFDAHTQLFKRAGFTLDRVEVCQQALLRCQAANRELANGAFTAVVHVGSRLTSVAVVRDGNPYYMRDFPIGGSEFTYAMQMGAQNQWAEARDYKHAYNATARDVPFEPVLTRWIDQIRRSLDAFTRQFKAQAPQISQVTLSGGGACMRGLDVRLQEVLARPVSAEVWGRVRPAAATNGSPLAPFLPAVGLCL